MTLYRCPATGVAVKVSMLVVDEPLGVLNSWGP
jgi:hypothetical protein